MRIEELKECPICMTKLVPSGNPFTGGMWCPRCKMLDIALLRVAQDEPTLQELIETQERDITVKVAESVLAMDPQAAVEEVERILGGGR
jgi:hypothetical protein